MQLPSASTCTERGVSTPPLSSYHSNLHQPMHERKSFLPKSSSCCVPPPCVSLFCTDLRSSPPGHHAHSAGQASLPLPRVRPRHRVVGVPPSRAGPLPDRGDEQGHRQGPALRRHHLPAQPVGRPDRGPAAGLRERHHGGNVSGFGSRLERGTERGV